MIGVDKLVKAWLMDKQCHMLTVVHIQKEYFIMILFLYELSVTCT